VRIVETTLQQRPAPAAAPPPTRGVSVRGRPAEEPAATTPPAQPPAAAPQPEKPEGSGDDASARFSLLELD
jgi:hypothetical protein